MSTSIKQQGLHVTNAETDTSTSNSYSEKHQGSLQAQANQHIYQYQSLLVQNAEALMESFYQRKLKASMGYNNYDGLDIYNSEDGL